MKSRFVFLLSALWCASAFAASPTPETNGAGYSRSLPVLVRVDSHGKLTEAMPAYTLSPRLDRLVRKSLNDMVTKPATYHGRPVASQAVIFLALDPEEDAQSGKVVHCSFISIKPVPSGQWHWLHLDGRRLALASNEVSPSGYSQWRRPGSFPDLPRSQIVQSGSSTTSVQPASAAFRSMMPRPAAPVMSASPRRR